MAEPKIFTKNYVSADCDITVSHGDGSKHYLYDRDKASTWLTSGANDDATQVSIEVSFKEGSIEAERDIDRIILVNHNLKAWEVFYWDGDSWESLDSEAADAADTTVIAFNQVSTTKIKLEATATQVEDAEKYIGELIACALQVDVGVDFDNYEPHYREKRNAMALGDGGLHSVVTRFSSNRISKYEATATLMFASAALTESLRAIKETGEPYLFQPESVTTPDDIFYVHWTNPWAAPYSARPKAVGYTIRMELKEA